MNPIESDPNGVSRNARASREGVGATMLARDPINSEIASSEARAAEPARPSRPLAAGESAKMIHRIDSHSPEKANRQALDDLGGGAEGFAIVFEGAPNAFGRGLPATAEALAAALRDLPLGRLHLRIDAHPQSRAAVDWLVRILAARRLSPERLDISFGIDPAASFAGTGMMRMSIEALKASMPQSLAHFFALGVPGILLEADGRVFHNAGADDALELGAALASTVGYLRMFEEARQPALYAAAHVGFAISVEQDRAATEIKLAALCRLWDRLLDGYDVERMPLRVHAETSYRMMTALDADTNVARATLSALGAMEAGVTTVAALPSDVAQRQADDTMPRRMRGVMSALSREAGAAREMPWHDSAFDRAVGDLCEAAWAELRRIEAEGGILRSISDGHLQRRVLAARDERAALLAPVAAGVQAKVAGRLSLPRARRPDAGVGAIYCQRMDPVRWEELSAAAAA